MRIALTFDDGPSEWTGHVLDHLAAHDQKATFFVCGAHILGNVAAVDRIVAEGHELGNHTTNHPSLAALGEVEVRKEIAETTAMIHAVTGRVPTFWRAPYLQKPRPMPEYPVHLGCDVIPGDWQESDPQVIAGKVLDNLHDHAVVLLHDGRPVGQPRFDDGGSLDSRQATVDALGILLPEFAVRGVECVTASELF